MKKNYSENVKGMLNKVKEMIKFAKSTAYFNFNKAKENFFELYNADPSKVTSEIVYSDYVKENCPFINLKIHEAKFNIPAWSIVAWITNEGELEINDFINENEDNETAMALLDFVLTEKYYIDIEALYNKISVF